MCGDTLHTGLEGKSPKEKTAMMMLIEKLEDMIIHGGDPDLSAAHTHATKLLATERKQIKQAVWWGHDNKPEMIYPSEDWATEYYESKYGNK